jgi:hypothetical protein
MPDTLHEVNTVDLDVAATHMVTLIPRVQADATVESVLELLSTAAEHSASGAEQKQASLVRALERVALT